MKELLVTCVYLKFSCMGRIKTIATIAVIAGFDLRSDCKIKAS